jgi:hypothetical protein
MLPLTTAVRDDVPFVGGPLVSLAGAGGIAQVTPIGGMIGVLSTSTGDIGQDGTPPVIVYTTPGATLTVPASVGGGASSGSVEGVVTPSAPVASDSTPSAAAGSVQSGSVSWGGANHPGTTTHSAPAIAQPTIGTPPSAPITIAAAVPDTKHAEVEGTITQGNNSVTVEIPIGPMTRELGLSLRGELGIGAAQGPFIGQMSLVDRNGDTLEHLAQLWNSSTGEPADAVTLSLNGVPIGGSLIVQISTPPSLGPGSSMGSADSASTPGWTLPFVMDVQRMETTTATSTGGVGSLTGFLAAAGGFAIGALPGTSNSQVSGATGGGSSGVPATAPDPAIVDQGVITQTGEESASDGAEAANFGARIATGPLAARTASPLGPNLSTVVIDPVPATDRHERALSQEIAASELAEGREHGDESFFPGDHDFTPDGGADGIGPAGGAVTSIAGLGPLHLKVSRPGAGHAGGELDALRAALSNAMCPEDQLAAVFDEDQAGGTHLVAMNSPMTSDRDRRPALDFLTSAFILAVGMGLVTGPIIPDLLRLFPARSSRWRGMRTAAGGLPTAGSPDRVFGSWLRRRFGC